MVLSSCKYFQASIQPERFPVVRERIEEHRINPHFIQTTHAMSTTTPVSKANAALDKLPAAIPHPHLPENKEEVKEDVAIAAQKSMAGLRSLAAGGFGGVCAVISGHPFDLVKVRLQTAEAGVYKGAIDCLMKGIAKDGLARGLYAGVSAPLVGVTPMCMSHPNSVSSICCDPLSRQIYAA